MHTSFIRVGIISCVVIALLVASTTGSMSRPPRAENINDVAEALKYLQDLETYYGDKARPRFGKRVAAALLAQRWRDRFTAPTDMTDYSAIDQPF